MRGIYEARYRDRQMMTFQAEIRRHLIGRFDATVFGALGEIARRGQDFTTGADFS